MKSSMKSEIELKLEKASKMLSMGKLTPKNEKFIRSLKNKKDIGKITKRQYEWLTNIIQEYKEVSIFKGVREDAQPDPKLKIYNIKSTELKTDWFDNL